MIKLTAGLFILFIAFLLQFLFAAAGVSVNLAFAALISFAFLFEFWELLLLTVIAVLIVNWQPAVSPEILVFALFPAAAHFSRDVFRWAGWLTNAVAILVGFFILAIAAAPAAIAQHLQPFLVDVAAGELFGAIVFLPLYRVGRR
jgi:hypothetical protein